MKLERGISNDLLDSLANSGAEWECLVGDAKWGCVFAFDRRGRLVVVAECGKVKRKFQIKIDLIEIKKGGGK